MQRANNTFPLSINKQKKKKSRLLGDKIPRKLRDTRRILITRYHKVVEGGSVRHLERRAASARGNDSMQKNSIIPRERVRETDSFTDFCIEQAEEREGRRDGNWGRQRRWERRRSWRASADGGKKKKGEEIVETWEVGRRSRGWVGVRGKWREKRGRSPGWTSHRLESWSSLYWFDVSNLLATLPQFLPRETRLLRMETSTTLVLRATLYFSSTRHEER